MLNFLLKIDFLSFISKCFTCVHTELYVRGFDVVTLQRSDIDGHDGLWGAPHRRPHQPRWHYPCYPYSRDSLYDGCTYTHDRAGDQGYETHVMGYPFDLAYCFVMDGTRHIGFRSRNPRRLRRQGTRYL